MNKKLIAIPAILLASTLLLSGCSSAVSEVEEVSTSPAPTAVEETPKAEIAESTVIPITLGDVEGVPGDVESVLAVDYNEDGTTGVIFAGTGENILTLQKGFEDAGYSWVDLSEGLGTNVSAVNEQFSVIISVVDTETYSYTIFTN